MLHRSLNKSGRAAGAREWGWWGKGAGDGKGDRDRGAPPLVSSEEFEEVTTRKCRLGTSPLKRSPAPPPPHRCKERTTHGDGKAVAGADGEALPRLGIVFGSHVGLWLFAQSSPYLSHGDGKQDRGVDQAIHIRGREAARNMDKMRTHRRAHMMRCTFVTVDVRVEGNLKANTPNLQRPFQPRTFAALRPRTAATTD